jgi:hypothetical protein
MAHCQTIDPALSPTVYQNQVKLTCDARSLSEAPRAMKIDEWGDAGPGALSIEPLEVSRWRGEQDVVRYGF